MASKTNDLVCLMKQMNIRLTNSLSSTQSQRIQHVCNETCSLGKRNSRIGQSTLQIDAETVLIDKNKILFGDLNDFITIPLPIGHNFNANYYFTIESIDKQINHFKVKMNVYLCLNQSFTLAIGCLYVNYDSETMKMNETKFMFDSRINLMLKNDWLSVYKQLDWFIQSLTCPYSMVTINRKTKKGIQFEIQIQNMAKIMQDNQNQNNFSWE